MLDAAMGVLDDPQFAHRLRPRAARGEAPVIGRLGRDTDQRPRRPPRHHGHAEILIVDYKTDRPSPPTVGGRRRGLYRPDGRLSRRVDAALAEPSH